MGREPISGGDPLTLRQAVDGGHRVGGVLQVDVAALRTLSTSLGSAADILAAADGAEPGLEAVAGALASSVTGQACAAAGLRVQQALATLAGRISTTGTAVSDSADTYPAAEARFERELQPFGGL